jgi:outer membrane receptor protein involved in Fe transport
MVDRVEVVKGPVGGVYGPAAFLAVVNVVTRTPGASGGTISAVGTAAQGRVLGADGAATWEGRFGELAAAVGVEVVGTRGYAWTWPELVSYPDRTPPPGGRVEGRDHGDTQKGYLRASWRGHALLAGCGRWQRQIPSAPYSSNLLDSRNHEESLSCFAQVSHHRTLSPGLDLDLRLSADAYEYRDLWAYPEPAEGGVGPFRDRGSDRWLGGDARLGWRSGALTVTAGITGEAHRTSQFSGSDRLPPVTVDPLNGSGAGEIRKDYLTVNAYALGEAVLGGGLSLHGGLTWYRHQIFGSRLTPRLAAVWQVGQSDTLKALYTEGFRAPAATEAFFNDVTDFIANPALRPELARSGELVWERRLHGGLSLAASLFWTAYERLIAIQTIPRPGVVNPDPANPGDFVLQANNEDAFQVRGLDVSASARLGELLRVRAAVSAQQALGDRPANFAPWTASLVASSRAPWRPLELALQAALLGPRRKLGAGEEFSLQPGQRPSVPAAFRLDAAATLEVPGARGLTCQLAVRNLLDRDTLHPVSGDFAPISEMAEPPRTLHLSVRYRF